MVTISTDNITETNEFRGGVSAHWTFLSDPRRTVQKDLDIAEYTDPGHNPMIPYTIVLEPGLVIYKIYNGYWFFGRPTADELRQDSACRDEEMPAGLGHHDARIQGGLAAGAERNCSIRMERRTPKRSANRISSGVAGNLRHRCGGACRRGRAGYSKTLRREWRRHLFILGRRLPKSRRKCVSRLIAHPQIYLWPSLVA